MLSVLLIAPLFTVGVIFLVGNDALLLVRRISLYSSLFIFNYVVFLFCYFDSTTTAFQLVERMAWVDSMNVNATFAIDSISYFMILLTAFLIPICVLLC